ncbi:ribonuclease P protein component [Candidatus Peregrinibacteria bacterium]|nr:ribonuclease P protein component [Candidatus Peregrinibacteria bacterium]
MLSKRFKIGNRPRIEYIYKKGRRVSGRFFQLRYLPNRLAFCRFSLIMPSKLGILAVERNKIRRRFYEAIRLGLQRVPKMTQTCYDVAVLLSRHAAQAGFAAIKQEILNSIKKLPS